ncbi:enoyl-CoA hydratase-related protein [Spirillospora sp. CA-255316]
MPDRPLVASSVREHVAVITFDRPEALNALNKALTCRLATALEAADRDPAVRAVVLTGSDRAFCAGADITELDTVTVDQALDPLGFGRRLFDVLSSYRKPLIAAVRGPALGGGCEIALACDIVVAARSATFALPEVTLGAIPGAGGTQRLVHAIGKAKAMRLLLTGAAITATDAHACGLVSDVTDDDACVPTAVEIGAQIARNAPLAVQMAKDAAKAANATTLPQGLAHERRNFFLLLHTTDLREGVRAFRAKRRPTFTGR